MILEGPFSIPLFYMIVEYFISLLRKNMHLKFKIKFT